MTVVVVLTLAGLVALVIAVITDSTALALVVISLALLGIILLLRDWRADRRQTRIGEDSALDDDAFALGGAGQSPLSADKFTPDISTDPDGPPSDARAD